MPPLTPISGTWRIEVFVCQFVTWWFCFLTNLEQSAVGVTWKVVDDAGAVDKGHEGGDAEVATDGEGVAEELHLVRYFIIRVHCLSELSGCARLQF